MSVTCEKLYDEVWNEPITKVSKRYGVSDKHEHFKKIRDSRSPYLKPFKKRTIDLIVSKDTLERGL